jgi:hypothetical protein
MQPRDCFNCGKPAEPPFILASFEYPPELVSAAESAGMSIKSDRVLCSECFDEIRQEAEAYKELEAETRSGSRCWVCGDQFNSPGGISINLDGTIRRVCPNCKDWIKHQRKKQGL